jgi:hypothetical protein
MPPSTNKSIADNQTTIEQLRDELAAANTLVDDLPPTPLVECPVCRKVGLPERIEGHACETGHVH